MSHKVQIHLYDLSQGMAKQLSMAFIGKQIEGIWHTGLIVYGKEYYYGGGICKDPIGKTPYGMPLKTIDVGETDIPEEIFLDFLKDVSERFTMDKYDLFENNCNNFTDTACEFLTGKGIPEFITGLPKDVLATPFGQMIKPLIDGFTRSINQNSHPLNPNQPAGPSLPSMFEGQNNPSMINFGNRAPAPTTNTTTAPTGPAVVQEVSTIEQFFEVLDANPAVIVDFFSYTCPPCMRIKPFFENLARDFQKTNPKLKFISVNTQVGREIAMNHNITAIPTFIGFFDALQVERFSGADQTKLMNLAHTLDAKIKSMPGNNTQQNTNGIKTETTGTKVNTDTKASPEKVSQGFNPANKEFSRFEGETYGLAINSIKSTLEKFPTLNQSESKAIFVAFSQNSANAKSIPEEEKYNLVKWLLDTLFFIDISDKAIGFIDLLKMLALDKGYATAIAKNGEQFSRIIKFLDKPEAGLKEIQKGLRLVLLRLITNVTAHEETKSYLQSEVIPLVKYLSVAAKAYKDENPALIGIFRTLWNLTQNLNGTQEFEEVKGIVVGLATDILNTSQENDLVLACVQILSLVSFNNRALRSTLNDNLNRQKLTKLETSTDAKVAKATKDLTSILDGKAF